MQLDLVTLDGDARVNARRGQSSECRQGHRELVVGLAGQVDESAGRADAGTIVGDLVREVLLPHTVDHQYQNRQGARGRELRRKYAHKDRVRLGRGQAEVDDGKVVALRGNTEEIDPSDSAGGIRPAHHCSTQIIHGECATLRVVRNRGVGLPADV